MPKASDNSKKDKSVAGTEGSSPSTSRPTAPSPTGLGLDPMRTVYLLPPGTLVPIEWVRELLEEDKARAPLDLRGFQADLTVKQVAAHFERKPQTVLDWIKKGELRAYLFKGREYRITPAALEEFTQAQRSSKPRKHIGRSELTSWRKLYDKSGDSGQSGGRAEGEG